MKTFIPEVQALLSNTLSIPVYYAKVPEGADLPAAYFIGAGMVRGKTINRKRTPDKATFRIGIVVTDLSQSVEPTEQLESIDLTTNSDFQEIDLAYTRTEDQDEDSTAQRLFIDLNVTEKIL